MTSKKPTASQGATQRDAERSERQSADSLLDEALQESFPASDPIAVDLTDPHRAQPQPGSAEQTKRQ